MAGSHDKRQAVARHTNKNNKGGATIVRIFILLSLLLAQSVFANIKNIRIEDKKTHTTVVLDLTRQPEHQAFYLSHPERVVLDLEGAKMQPGANSLSLPIGLVNSIRSARRNQKDRKSTRLNSSHVR